MGAALSEWGPGRLVHAAAGGPAVTSGGGMRPGGPRSRHRVRSRRPRPVCPRCAPGAQQGCCPGPAPAPAARAAPDVTGPAPPALSRDVMVVTACTIGRARCNNHTSASPPAGSPLAGLRGCERSPVRRSTRSLRKSRTMSHRAAPGPGPGMPPAPRPPHHSPSHRPSHPPPRVTVSRATPGHPPLAPIPPAPSSLHKSRTDGASLWLLGAAPRGRAVPPVPVRPRGGLPSPFHDLQDAHYRGFAPPGGYAAGRAAGRAQAAIARAQRIRVTAVSGCSPKACATRAVQPEPP